MKTSTRLFALAAIGIAIFSNCNTTREKDNKSETLAVNMNVPLARSEKAPNEGTYANGGTAQKELQYSGSSSSFTVTPLSSSAAVENAKDSSKFFIRTADLKFKTKNVISSTYAIEDAVNQLGGYVSYTSLNSTAGAKSVVAISADSSLETNYYTVVNTLTIRVPNVKLDSTLKAIAPLVDYLDYRVIKANDVGMQLQSNKLLARRSAKHGERIASDIDKSKSKLEQVADAERDLTSQQEQRDNAALDNLSLLNQVKYSTINASLYQAESVSRSVVANDKNIAAYQPAFTSQMLDAFRFGWDILETLLVVAAKLWSVILLGVLSLILFQAIRSKLKAGLKM